MPPQKGPSTKELVEIADIRDSIIILKNGSLRSVIEVGAINFELKGQTEQQGIIAGFQDFLNSVDFSLQIVISSRKLNITKYLTSVEQMAETIPNELLKIQATEYLKFIAGLAELSNIVSKKFYIVVPLFVSDAPSAGGGGLGVISRLRGLFSSSAIVNSFNDTTLEKYRGQMEQRIAVIASSLSGLGLGARVLEYDELLNIFYGYYNPSQAAVAVQSQS
jgi:hypothetical protein